MKERDPVTSQDGANPQSPSGDASRGQVGQGAGGGRAPGTEALAATAPGTGDADAAKPPIGTGTTV